MEETIKCAPKIPINLLPSLNTDCIQLKDTLKKSGYKKLFYPFLTLPPPPPPPPQYITMDNFIEYVFF